MKMGVAAQPEFKTYVTGRHAGEFHVARSGIGTIAPGCWLHLNFEGVAAVRYVNSGENREFLPFHAQLMVEPEEHEVEIRIDAQREYNSISLHLPANEMDDCSFLMGTLARHSSLGIDSVMTGYGRALLDAIPTTLPEMMQQKATALELFAHVFSLAHKTELRADITPAHTIVEQATAVVCRDGRFSLTALEMAQAIGVSQWQLRSAFKSITGSRYSDWIANVRLEKAYVLLVDPALQISQIAFMIGYNSPANFSTAFLRQTGVTPSKWRHDAMKRGDGYSSRDVWPGTSLRQ